MAFVLTPRFTPAYQGPQCSPFGFCAPSSRPSYTYRIARPRPQRPQYSSFNHFFAQVDELLSDLNHEAQRQAHLEEQRNAQLQQEQRNRTPHAEFAVSQTEQGWQVDGDIKGFEQQNISIEVTDEHTLKIAGNTEWHAEKKAELEHKPVEHGPVEKTEVDTLTEPEYDTLSADKSDTTSHKSYQATVEDDFEDLGAETSSLISSTTQPSSPAEIKEPKGKETVARETVSAQEPQHDEIPRGAFERTYRFPSRIDAAAVSASFQNGTLKVTVPKAQVQPVQRIAIQ